MVKRWTFIDVFIMIFLLLVMLLSLLPILNTFAISLSDRISASTGKVTFWPVGFTLVAYENMIRDNLFFLAFFNSVVRVLLGSSINIIVIISMAFPLSKNSRIFQGRNVYMWIIVFVLLFNGGLVPNFLLIKNLGLFDTIWALVLPPAVPVFSVLILMNYIKGLPSEMEEAALVDGADPLKTLIYVILPLSIPCLATVGLFSVVFHWNTFFDGLIYMNKPEKLPLQSFIRSLVVESNIRFEFLTSEEIERQLKLSNLTFNSAKIMVSMIPILLIYPFLQKYFVTGIVMGAVKG